MTAASSGFFDRVSELMESSSGKLFEFIVGSGVTVALVILIIFGIVRGVRALRRWQVSRLRYERSFSAPGVFEGDVCELYEKITNPTPLPMLRCFHSLQAWNPSCRRFRLPPGPWSCRRST